MEAAGRWRRRIASLAALLNAAYLVLGVMAAAAIVKGVFDELGSGETPDVASWGLFLAVPDIWGAVVIGLAIVSPLLTWLVALAVGLWRGRRWARIGGLVTFFVLAAVLVVVAASGVRDLVGLMLGAGMFAGPSIIGLLALATGSQVFQGRPTGGQGLIP